MPLTSQHAFELKCWGDATLGQDLTSPQQVFPYAFSPVTLLADAIYIDCQHKGIALLDIGTASDEGQANHGLIRFKRGLGCEASLKFRLEKIIEP